MLKDIHFRRQRNGVVRHYQLVREDFKKRDCENVHLKFVYLNFHLKGK